MMTLFQRRRESASVQPRTKSALHTARRPHQPTQHIPTRKELRRWYLFSMPTAKSAQSFITPSSHTPVPFLNAIERLTNQTIDLFGGIGAALCQAAHFPGHHSKATALLTG